MLVSSFGYLFLHGGCIVPLWWGFGEAGCPLGASLNNFLWWLWCGQPHHNHQKKGL